MSDTKLGITRSNRVNLGKISQTRPNCSEDIVWISSLLSSFPSMKQSLTRYHLIAMRGRPSLGSEGVQRQQAEDGKGEPAVRGQRRRADRRGVHVRGQHRRRLRPQGVRHGRHADVVGLGGPRRPLLVGRPPGRRRGRRRARPGRRPSARSRLLLLHRTFLSGAPFSFIQRSFEFLFRSSPYSSSFR